MDEHAGTKSAAYPHDMQCEVLKFRDRNRNMSPSSTKPQSETSKLWLSELSTVPVLVPPTKRTYSQTTDSSADEDDYSHPSKVGKVAQSATASHALKLKRTASATPPIATSRATVKSRIPRSSAASPYNSLRSGSVPFPDRLTRIPRVPRPSTSTSSTSTASTSSSSASTSAISTASVVPVTATGSPPTPVSPTRATQPSPDCFHCKIATELTAKAVHSSERFESEKWQMAKAHEEAIKSKDIALEEAEDAVLAKSDEYDLGTALLENEIQVSKEGRAKEKKRLEGILTQKDVQISNLKSEIATKDRTILDHERASSEKDENIIQLQQQLQQKKETNSKQPDTVDGSTVSEQQNTADHDDQIAKLNKGLEDIKATLNAVSQQVFQNGANLAMVGTDVHLLSKNSEQLDELRRWNTNLEETCRNLLQRYIEITQPTTQQPMNLSTPTPTTWTPVDEPGEPMIVDDEEGKDDEEPKVAEVPLDFDTPMQDAPPRRFETPSASRGPRIRGQRLYNAQNSGGFFNSPQGPQGPQGFPGTGYPPFDTSTQPPRGPRLRIPEPTRGRGKDPQHNRRGAQARGAYNNNARGNRTGPGSTGGNGGPDDLSFFGTPSGRGRGNTTAPRRGAQARGGYQNNARGNPTGRDGANRNNGPNAFGCIGAAGPAAQPGTPRGFKDAQASSGNRGRGDHRGGRGNNRGRGGYQGAGRSNPGDPYNNRQYASSGGDTSMRD